MNNTAITILSVVIIVLVGVGAFMMNRGGGDSVGNIGNTPAGDSGGSQSPFTTLEGEPVTLEDFKGSVVVANAWATWCPFCVNELPDFAELAREFEGEGVVVVAINRKEDVAKQQDFLNTIASTERIHFWVDEGDAFYRSIGGFTMPETVFYDREGNVSFHKRGFMALSEMRQHTEAALEAN